MPKTTILNSFLIFYTFLPKTQNCVKRLSRNSLIVFSYKKDVENETFSSSPTYKRWPCDAKQSPNSSKKILQTINGVEKTMNKKQLIAPSTSITCTISGGQDSVFLLFCLSVLQPQLNFNLKLIWCNHFWQTSSFYTTLHLTKCAVSFSSPIIGFLPFQINISPSFYKTVITTYKKNDSVKACFKKKSTALEAKPALHPLYVKFGSNVEMQSPAFLQHRYLKAKKILVATRFVRRSPRGDLYSPQKKFRDAPLRTLFFCTPGLTIKPAFLWSLLSYKIKLKEKGYKGFLEKTSEVEARNWRHITTERGSTFYDSKQCVYGHTGSDRVETILFNLVRGSGSRGVACLPWKREHSHFCYNKFYPSYKQVIKNTHLRRCHTFTEKQNTFSHKSYTSHIRTRLS